MNFTLKCFSFFHSKKLHLLPILCCISLFLLSLIQRNLQIFPGLSNDKISAFDDHENGGRSRAMLRVCGPSCIKVEYTLDEKLQYPYSGIKLVLKNGEQYRDLSGYEYLTVELTAKTGQEINIFLHTIIPGFTDESKALTYGYQLRTIRCTHPRQKFILPLKSFAVPTWWCAVNKFPADSLLPENYRQVAEIIMQNGYDAEVKVPYSITVHRLAFRKSIAKRALAALIAVIVWIIIYSLLYLMYKNYAHRHHQPDVKQIIIPYESLDVGNDSDECLNRIVTCIARKYKNQNLSLRQVADEAGVSPVKITQTLREKKQCSYKQYLNSIRLNEAKRLLRETDRNIVEIAQKVGYNNISHFNRIFKDLEGISPRQFRAAAENRLPEVT